MNDAISRALVERPRRTQGIPAHLAALRDAVMAGAETAGDLAGNYFFDYGAKGAEFLQDPALMVRGALGNREAAEQYQANYEQRRAQLPTLDPSDATAQQQQQWGEAIKPTAAALAKFVQEKAPNLTQAAGDYLSDPSVQTFGDSLELFGVPAMRAGRYLQGAFKESMAAPSVLDQIGGYAVARQAPGADAAMVTYHGSPHKFDRFSMDKLGTGEGAQAYGHGLYFAESPKVAGDYRRRLSNNAGIVETVNYYGGKEVSGNTPEGILTRITNANSRPPTEWDVDTLAKVGNITSSEAEKAKAIMGDFEPSLATQKDMAGNLYEVDIPDEKIAQMLDWDAGIDDQPQAVRDALLKWRKENGASFHSGESAYKEFTQQARMNGAENPEAAASMMMSKIGIPGIKYLDGTSRSNGEGTRNFVLFDENDAKILKRNNEAFK